MSSSGGELGLDLIVADDVEAVECAGLEIGGVETAGRENAGTLAGGLGPALASVESLLAARSCAVL